MQHSNAANRLDRLPIASLHKNILFAVAIAYFFEFADLNRFAIIVPKLMNIWGVSVNTVAYVTSFSFLAMAVGSAIGGWLADFYGRKKALTITVMMFTIISVLSGFAWDIWTLGLCRIVGSAGLAAMTVIAVIYVNEMFPAKLRGKYQAYAMVIGICGTPVTNLIASAVVPLAPWAWRLVFIWGLLGFLYLLFSRRIFESPRWYESREQYDKADDILCRIENEVRREKGALPVPPLAVPEVKIDKTPIAVLFQRKYLGTTLLLTVVWVTETIGFFGYSSWAPALLAKEGFSAGKSIFYIALTTVGAPLGPYIASMVTDRFERKWCLAIFGAIIGASGLLYGLTFNPIMIVLFGFIVNLFERGYTALGYAYSPELYDTKVRSIGTGLSYGAGRLSNALGPIIIAYLYSTHGYRSVFYFIAATWFIGALTVGFFGPKTKCSESNKLEISMQPDSN
ncbi:sugar transport proteins signature 1 [Lucifera butyrica]|uniref:Sugar transport proteins signature 1 n=2 Tax=Lucifera butyrica TaxID=1351585 RepID=A0A498REV4_9FIRM|nr:sugar transport proteins signature 1 [Lucifera butyrica]